MPRCPRCSSANDDGRAVCHACGAALASDANDKPTVGTTPTSARIDSPTIATLPESRSGGTASDISSGGPLGPGSRLGDRYEIVSILGTGGMGVVYRARDLRLQRDVALKVIRPELLRHPTILERFHREVQLASQVTHRHILRIHDLVEVDGLSCLSMEYVEGTTLADRLERSGRLAPEVAVELAIQLCDALQAAHDAGVVHRDLKPQNILVDAEGRAYVADFGISRSIEAGQTMTEHGAVIGTMDYMSPEQARGEVAGPQSDIYSLGLVLYQMLTGTLPFAGESAITSILKRVQQDVPDPRQTGIQMPPWLAQVVARALRREVAERYGTAEEMQRDLARHTATRGRRRLPKALRPGLAAAVAIAGLALAGAWVLDRRGPETGSEALPAAEPRTSIALLPFANETGDPKFDWVRTGLPDLIHTDLLQVAALRLASPDRAGEVLGGLGLAPGDAAEPRDLGRAADLLSVENLLSGRLFRTGQRFRIEATIQRVVGSASAGTAAIRVDGEGEEALFDMVDELVAKVRAELGLALARGEQDVEVGKLSTRSVAALGDYREGVELSLAGKTQDAITKLEAAIEADPTFAQARTRLAAAYLEIGHDDKAKAAAAAALQGLRPGALPAEAARIRAVQARIDGDLPAAQKALEELSAATPHDTGVLLDLADVQEERGQLDAALGTLDRVLALDDRNPSAQFRIGRVRAKSGKTDEAFEAFASARAIYTETKNDAGLATTLNGIGTTNYMLGRLDDALAAYEEALGLREAMGDQRAVRLALHNIAQVQKDRGRFDEALEIANRALAVSRLIGEREGEAVGWSILGDIHSDAGRPEEALRAFQESLRLSRETRDEEVTARSLANLGFISAVLGKYVEASFFQAQALEKRRALGEKNVILRTLIEVGFVEQVQGRYDAALRAYAESLDLAKESGDRAAESAVRINLAELHDDRGDYAAALEALALAEQEARAIGDDRLIATALAYRVGIELHLGNAAAASEPLDQARRLVEPTGNRPLSAEITILDGERLLALGRIAEATTTLDRATRDAEATGDHRLILRARLRRGIARGAVREIDRISSDAQAAGLIPLAAVGRAAAARARLDSGKAAPALASAESALATAGSLGLAPVILDARAVAARALERLSRDTEALEQYGAALDPLEAIAGRLDPTRRGPWLARQEIALLMDAAQAAFDRGGRDREKVRLAAVVSR